MIKKALYDRHSFTYRPYLYLHKYISAINTLNSIPVHQHPVYRIRTWFEHPLPGSLFRILNFISSYSYRIVKLKTNWSFKHKIRSEIINKKLHVKKTTFRAMLNIVIYNYCCVICPRLLLFGS